MNRRFWHTAILGSTICVSFSIPTHAQTGNVADLEGWQGTKWGMSVSAVRAAIGSEAHSLGSPELYGTSESRRLGLLVIDRVDLGSVPMKVVFQFSADSAHLVGVLLSQVVTHNTAVDRSDSFAVLERLLSEKYGPKMYGDGKREASVIGRKVDLQASWSFPHTVIELDYLYLEGVISNLTILYRPPSKAKI